LYPSFQSLFFRKCQKKVAPSNSNATLKTTPFSFQNIQFWKKAIIGLPSVLKYNLPKKLAKTAFSTSLQSLKTMLFPWFLMKIIKNNKPEVNFVKNTQIIL
jgi:hypothetical protein